MNFAVGAVAATVVAALAVLGFLLLRTLGTLQALTTSIGQFRREAEPLAREVAAMAEQVAARAERLANRPASPRR